MSGSRHAGGMEPYDTGADQKVTRFRMFWKKLFSSSTVSALEEALKLLSAILKGCHHPSLNVRRKSPCSVY